ncbi:hypothetical protein N8I77_009609 [Diaporthe amygdali]|uniref:CorA-like transporter domain-containing protein n=1 Tax=Phomopsis amygdali TaxID=1214568 RepID=A0AAD9SA55_PHOAM|nr:hypothetical protein N8I77_009609 [Diaporthe amygdali]
MQASSTRASTQGRRPRHSLGLDRLCLEAYQNGLEYLWDDFESKISNLLVESVDDSLVGVAITGSDQVQWITKHEELRTILQKGSSKLILLNRYNSWSRINIAIDSFSVVCQLSGLTPYFLQFMIGMGRKFSSKDEDFMSCYSTFSADGGLIGDPGSEIGTGGDARWALCYNIRYFEQHGRDMEDPWSCRQSALHHSFSPVSEQSIWVVIQPPQAFHVNMDSGRHVMSLHIRYLRGGLANWREYFDFFAQRFNILIAIPNPYHKFKIKFSHEQHLHNLRGKLRHAQNILANTRHTFKTIREHGSALAHWKGLLPADHAGFNRELDNLSQEVEGYIGTAHKLIRMSDDLKSMYENILTFHGQELQHDTSLKLTQLVQADAIENRDMAVLADLTYKDSRTMRIATVIAMFYLPANLVMSFFSSTLVWFGTTTDAAENQGSKLQIRSEVWMATVAAIVLAAATIGWSWWWNFKEQRTTKKKKASHKQP